MRSFQAATRQPALESACIALDLLEGIDQRLSGAGALSDENIHWIRKSCKKLRALLRLIRSGLDDGAFRAADGRVRAYAKQLAHARDSSVLLDTIALLEKHFGELLAPNALEPVSALLVDGANVRHVHIPEVAVMQAGLIEICDSFAQLDYADITPDTLVDGVLDNYRRGRKALARLERQPDDDTAHVLRRHTKYLYNQFSFLAGLNADALGQLVEDYHRVEDTLGLVHDLTVLIETVRNSKTLREQPLHRELLLSLAESRWLSLLSDGIHLARRLYRRKPAEQREWLRGLPGLGETGSGTGGLPAVH